ncbi:MAG TPA: ZIP family metal transporter [Ktedonobacteraceae bacterium]|nr:ZIP family metal transporter [Ktedonobacteraceae bacterium]
MPTQTIILLGAFAGLTIYFGLPLAFLKTAPQGMKNFASMFATGVLVFLLYDVVGKASEPITAALSEMHLHHTGTGTFVLDLILMVLGLGIGSIGLVYFNKFVAYRMRVGKEVKLAGVEAVVPVAIPQPVAAGSRGSSASMPEQEARPASVIQQSRGVELAPQMLALLIAIGIGLHNFSEGLAIGQSSAAGEIQLATVLIIGFGLHNMTEGFGIAGPLTGQKITWKFIALLGLIGGGPTFLGTITGIVFHSPEVFIFSLALAAGAILYVVTELLGVAKRFRSPSIVMWGLLLGFLLGYITDLIVTYAGA